MELNDILKNNLNFNNLDSNLFMYVSDLNYPYVNKLKFKSKEDDNDIITISISSFTNPTIIHINFSCFSIINNLLISNKEIDKYFYNKYREDLILLSLKIEEEIKKALKESKFRIQYILNNFTFNNEVPVKLNNISIYC